MLRRGAAGMRILALDPASTRTGYANFTASHNLYDAGYLTGADGDKEATDRILTMCHELETLIDDRRPDLVVIEVTSGHVGTKRHKGGGAGLGVYGMAVGAIYVCACMLSERCGHEVWPVKENVWTRGIPKVTRRREVAMQVPRYKDAFAKDAGGDVADAINLGWWAYGAIRRVEAVG